MEFRKPILAVLILSASAFAQDVRYNFASDVNFEKFRTYKWVQMQGGVQLDQLVDQQLKSAIDTELKKKGLTRTENDNADLLVGYQAATSQEKQITTLDTGGPWAMGPGWGRGWYGPGMAGGGISTSTTSTIQIGQIDLDMYDPGAKQLVWRGTASKTLDMKASPEKRQKNLAKGAAKLLKNYPPKKKS